jgi:hypothetical protein
VDLEGQDLELLDSGVWSDDVEEALVVGYEARGLDFLVAADGLLASARLEELSLLENSRCSNSLVRYVCSPGSIKYRAVEVAGYHGQCRIFVGHP